MDALVSIVTAVYKADAYLPQCIESILNQTYPSLELILVDDGSPDTCPQICDRYALCDPRVKVIHQENRGAITARNVGIAAASGEYIMFVDSDDWIDERLIEQVMTLAPFSLAIFGCSQTTADGQTLSVTSATDHPRSVDIRDSDDFVQEILLNSLFGYACNKIYHRDAIGATQFEPWRDREDLTFNLEVFRNVTELAVSDQTGYFYRQHSASSLHITYNCPVPNYIQTAKVILQRASRLPIPSNIRLGDLAAKSYLLDAIHRYIKNNAYLSKEDKKKEIRTLFSDAELRRSLSLRHNLCMMHRIFSVCFKLRLSSLFYHIGVK